MLYMCIKKEKKVERKHTTFQTMLHCGVELECDGGGDLWFPIRPSANVNIMSIYN